MSSEKILNISKISSGYLVCIPEDVRKDVKRRIEDLTPGGGYVFSAVHNIQTEVPPENIVAFFEAAQEYRIY